MPKITQIPLRPSQEPLRWLCPSSALPLENPYDPEQEATWMGRAAHEAMAVLNPDLEALAKKHGVKRAELEDLYNRGCDKREKYFAAWGVVAPEYEVKLDGSTYTGTADVVDRARKPRPCIVDWKFGYKQHGYGPQLMAYAAAYADVYGLPEEGLDIFIVFVRHHDEPEEWRVTPEELAKFLELGKQVSERVGTHYNPGEHCGFCKRQLVCEQRAVYQRQAVSALVPMGPNDLTPTKIGEIWPRLGVIQKAIDQVKQIAKEQLKNQETIPLPTGETLALSEYTTSVFDASAVHDALLFAGLTTNQVLSMCSISKTKIQDLCDKHKIPFDQILEDVKADHGVSESRPIEKIIVKKGTKQ